jgi:hypothetical protein
VAIEIALDIEQLTYEVNTLLNAASLMNRICRRRKHLDLPSPRGCFST